MTRHSLIEARIFIFCLVLTIVSLLCGGCSQYVVTETYTSEATTYRSVAKQNLFLYYTSTKPFELVTPYMSFVTGGMEAYPDPNAVEAAVKGAVEGVRGL